MYVRNDPTVGDGHGAGERQCIWPRLRVWLFHLPASDWFWNHGLLRWASPIPIPHVTFLLWEWDTFLWTRVEPLSRGTSEITNKDTFSFPQEQFLHLIIGDTSLIIIMGGEESVPISGVSLFQGLYVCKSGLWGKKVSLYFRGFFRNGLHYINFHMGR